MSAGVNFKLDGEYTVYDLMLLIREQAGEYFKREWVASDAPAVKEYLKCAISLEQKEVFAVMFLDNKHRLIKFEIMFTGTIDSASVYPREVVKKALELNSCAVILSHNHPSGSSEPSQADRAITDKIKSALGMVDIRVLDHVVVGEDTTSFAELGLL